MLRLRWASRTAAAGGCERDHNAPTHCSWHRERRLHEAEVYAQIENGLFLLCRCTRAAMAKTKHALVYPLLGRSSRDFKVLLSEHDPGCENAAFSHIRS